MDKVLRGVVRRISREKKYQRIPTTIIIHEIINMFHVHELFHYVGRLYNNHFGHNIFMYIYTINFEIDNKMSKICNFSAPRGTCTDLEGNRTTRHWRRYASGK